MDFLKFNHKGCVTVCCYPAWYSTFSFSSEYLCNCHELSLSPSAALRALHSRMAASRFLHAGQHVWTSVPRMHYKLARAPVHCTHLYHIPDNQGSLETQYIRTPAHWFCEVLFSAQFWLCQAFWHCSVLVFFLPCFLFFSLLDFPWHCCLPITWPLPVSRPCFCPFNKLLYPASLTSLYVKEYLA